MNGLVYLSIGGMIYLSGIDFTGINEIPTPTAKRILAILRDNNFLTTIREPSGRRSAIFALKGLINIAEGRDVL